MAARGKKAAAEVGDVLDPDRPKLKPEFSVRNPETGNKRVRYIGDGSLYVPGRPAVLGAIEAVTEEDAEALIETGLYEAADHDAEPGVPAATSSSNEGGE